MYLSRRCDFVIEVPREVEIFFALENFIPLPSPFHMVVLRFACDPPIPVVQFVLWINKMKMIYVRLNVVNQNVREQKCSWLEDDQGTNVVIKEKKKSLPNQLSAVSTSQATLPRTLIVCSLFLHQENTESLKKNN